jgi:hypothetical protein
MEWQPIATAPFDRDLELAVFDTAGQVHALVFPCRRILGSYIRTSWCCRAERTAHSHRLGVVNTATPQCLRHCPVELVRSRSVARARIYPWI